VAHGVNPAVKEVETFDLAVVRSRARPEAQCRGLRPRHDAMLPRRQFGQRDVGCGELMLTMRLNPPHPAHNRTTAPAERPAATLSSHLNAQFAAKRATA
jgi:hypothetical protein